MLRRSLRVIAFTGAWLALVPGTSRAQYRCPVTVEWNGKPALVGEIRDVERPPTAQLWELLQTLSLSPAAGRTDAPDPTAVEQAALKGRVRVRIDGAGQVDLPQLGLVRNRYNTSAWVIAPADYAQIQRARKVPADAKTK